ncbi:MAG: hypothetical protein ACXVXO_12525 [Mycobacteriaceae bacterium]
MPWSNSRPGGTKTNAKYNSKKHRDKVAEYKALLEREGSAQCAQPICLMRSRLIVPGMKWCAGHDDTGTYYIGLVHQRCNVVDGARRGRARQSVTSLRW